jgi:4-hydroxyphenylpyruvate dioxygenase
LPGFENAHTTGAPDYGLRRFDHVVASLPEVAPVAKYIAGFTGFHEFVEFTAEEVGTAESGLNIVVLANDTETVLLNLTEPVHGTKRRSQVQTYLDQHGGPGVQHLALASDDVLGTVRGIRAAGGFEFLEPPPPSYYDGVRGRAGDVLSEAQIKECQELSVLVDRDDQGVLIQIFTKPVGDRYVA